MQRPGRKQPPVHVLPQAVARTLMHQMEERKRSEYEGQQAGVPGMGQPPVLAHQPAGIVVGDLLHPAFTTTERLFRVLPEEGWFDPALINPQHPVQFQLLSFRVPEGQAFWLFDYEFAVMRPSGIDPGDFFRAEDSRFSNQMGFDLTINSYRDANLVFGLDPAPVPVGRQEYEPPIGSLQRQPPQAFNRAAANSFAATAGPGTSLLPVRPNVVGPRGRSFTYVVGENAEVALNTVIFRPLRSNVSAIEGRLAGYLIHTNVSEALLQRVRPR